MSKKELTASEMARLGGKARAAKLSKEELSAIGKLGGRPRKLFADKPRCPRCKHPLNGSNKLREEGCDICEVSR